MKNKRILLVEDDADLGVMLKRYLNINQFEVEWGKNGEEGLQLFKEGQFDICIIDVMMPVMDGFTMAKKIIDLNPEVPFLFLTARKTPEDRIKGLRLGADDYVAKPFEVEELVLRVKNIIKRTDYQNKLNREVPSGHIKIGNYTFDLDNLELRIHNETNGLTEKEAKLLYFLVNHQNQLIRREDLLTAIWGKTDFFSGRSMDVFISKIRKYLKHDSTISIESVRGVGLQFIINS